MTEPRTNRLSIDGGQVKEDDHVASYKPIPDTDTGFRTSKSSLTKSKEKVSAEEEKLLQKEDEAKIVTRVDMADAKYVVGDHRNGDAKIELDANKKQFSGLTKEELLKYADDPFWVRLRWFMFVLFWALWLCMLAGAIAIIVRAPTCYPPPPKTWYEKGPLVEASAMKDYKTLAMELGVLKECKVQGVFTQVLDTYEVLDNPTALDDLKTFVATAKEFGMKVIVDLTPNFVSSTHKWFVLSENRTAEYDSYFIWRKESGFSATGEPIAPSKWVSVNNTPAWTWSEKRKEFYLGQYGSQFPDLNFSNAAVLEHFRNVIKMVMQAGAGGIRLQKARELFVNTTLEEEEMDTGKGSVKDADFTQYDFWKHSHTSDQLGLDNLFTEWSSLVDKSSANPGKDETVFTLAEQSRRVELYLLDRNQTKAASRPWSTSPLAVAPPVNDLTRKLTDRLDKGSWPIMQLTAPTKEASGELAELALLLPAAPLLDIQHINNETVDISVLSQLAALREDASIAHGEREVAAVPALNDTQTLLAVARWKAGHTGYAAVYNPHESEARANLTALTSVQDKLTIYHVSQQVKAYTNYTSNTEVRSDNVLVPPFSTVVLSYVPKVSAEK